MGCKLGTTAATSNFTTVLCERKTRFSFLIYPKNKEHKCVLKRRILQLYMVSFIQVSLQIGLPLKRYRKGRVGVLPNQPLGVMVIGASSRHCREWEHCVILESAQTTFFPVGYSCSTICCSFFLLYYLLKLKELIDSAVSEVPYK